jgi:tetratricopeptide (TPR) repeat protein
MPSSILKQEEFSHRYAVAIEACCEIAQAYFYLGKMAQAQHLLRALLHLVEASEAKPQDRLKLLLLYGQILTIDHFLNETDATLLFEPLAQARQIAQNVQDQQGLSDALSLLGQAHYFVTLRARVKSGASLNSSQDQGDYQESLTYQKQAFELRETLHDSRGMSESYFYLGLVHERWQQRELAVAHYTKALEIAEQAGHLLERSEPTRHLAGIALSNGELDQALTFALQALSLREAAGFRPHLPFDHLLLSTVYQAKGDAAHALLHAQFAVSLAAEIESSLARVMADERLRQLDQH